MEITLEAFLGQGGLELAQIGADHGLQIGVQHGRRAAFEFADFRQDLARRRDMLIGPDRPHGLGCAALILRIGEGVDEDDRDGHRPFFDELAGGRSRLFGIDGGSQRAVRQNPLRDLEPHRALDHRGEFAPQPPGMRAVAAPHLEHVAKTRGGDQADPRALALEERIGADGGPVDDCPQRRNRRESGETGEKPRGLVAAIGRDFGGAELSLRLIIKEQIGESAPDIDADDARPARRACAGRAHAALPGLGTALSRISRALSDPTYPSRMSRSIRA